MPPISVGADDIFVFVDAWRQSFAMLPPRTPLDARISWVHHRASSAMLVTSFTTAAAFFSNTVNFVIPVGLFGFFMSLLVMINYAMVCTMFPAVIVLHHHWFAGRGRLRALGMGCLAPCGKQHLLTPAPAPASADTDCPAPSVADLRLLERWFQTCVSGFVWRRRAAIVGFSTILSLFVLFGYALQMDKATEAMRTEVANLDASIEFAKAALETIRAQNRTYEQNERAKVALKVETLSAQTTSAVAKMDLERAKIEQELEAMASTIEMLAGPTADSYIDHVRLEAMKNGSVDKVLVVPTDMPGLKLTT